MRGFLEDIRIALRQCRNNPGFTAVVALTMALGIGANTASFSVIEAVILRPLPFGAPARLVWLNGKFPMTDTAAVSPPDFRDYRASTRTFDCLAALGGVASPSNLSGDKPEQVLTTIASANFFDCLGIHPLLGRDFISSDEQVSEPQVAILGYSLWKRDFAGQKNVVGKTLRLDGAMRTIIGVLPSDVPLLSEAQIWLPTPMLNRGMNMRMSHFLNTIGRLKPGLTLQQSQADLDAIALELQHQYPETNKGWFMRQRPLHDVLVGNVRPALLLIGCAVALLLLIACVNVANLLLARSVSRRREFAVRTALGATRVRMVRQALTESVTLSVLGGALGVIAAWVGIRALQALGSLKVPRIEEININSLVLGYTVGISVLTGIVFGLVPGLESSGGAFSEGLKESGRASAPGSHHRISSALVIGQIAMSLTLLVSSGLLLKSFWRLIHVSPGFKTDHVVTARVNLPSSNYGPYADPSARARFWDRVEDGVRFLPGVKAVGAISELPLTGQSSDDPFHIPGRVYRPSEFEDAQLRQVTPGYLSAMGIPLTLGRWLNQFDNATSPGVVIVNQAFVQRFFESADVLGKKLQLMGDPKATREIVGVVGNVRHFALGRPDFPEMYVPYAQFAPPTMNLVVQADANPSNLAAALDAQVSAVDKDITLSAVTSMDDVLDASVFQQRFSSELISAFAAFALTLAAVGLYGLLAHSVVQRKNEIGIRMALGASERHILNLVLRRGSGLALAGLVLGLAVSIPATRILTRMLFAVSPSDPQTLFAVALLLIAVALAACYIPARRAAKLDPIVALRHD